MSETGDTAPLPAASAGSRLGAFVLDVVILGAGLGFGWVIWAVAAVPSSRSPGKHVLHLRVVELATGQPARWYYTGTRELVLKLPILASLLVAGKAIGGAGSAVSVAVAFVVLALAAVSAAGSLFGGRSMFDLLIGTVVVDDEALPAPGSAVDEEAGLSDRVVAGTCLP